jgi:hypothetical protein
MESLPVSRASLVEAYIDALPFAPVAIVAVPGGGCRIEVGGPSSPAIYFKLTHIELVLGAAGLRCGPIDDVEPDAVAARLKKAARTMGAPFQTAAELRADAEKEVDKIVERVRATGQAGGLSAYNKAYRQYRLGQIAKAEPAVSHGTFIERNYTVTIVRQVAMTGRMI